MDRPHTIGSTVICALGFILAASRATAGDPCLFVKYSLPSGQPQIAVVDVSKEEIRHIVIPIAITGLLGAVVSSPDGERLYGTFTTFGDAGCPTASRLEVMNAITGESRKVIPLAAPGEAVAIAIRPDGQRLYVADNVAAKLFVVNTTTDEIERAVPLETSGGYCPSFPDSGEPQPIGLAVSLDGRWVVATTSFCGFDCRGTVSILDTTDNEIVRTVSATGALHAAFSDDSTRLFVARPSLFPPRILVLANPSGENAGEISLAAHDLTARTDGVYALGRSGIAVIDPGTNEVVRNIDVRGGVLATETERPRGYVTTLDGVSAVDLISGSVIDQYEIPDPLGLSIGTCPPAAGCFGDCDGSGSVTVDELSVLISAALGQPSVVACPFADSSEDRRVTVENLVAAVNNALLGCD